MVADLGNENGASEVFGRDTPPRRNDPMMPLNLVRHVATALVSLLGYPRTISDELRGRLLG